MKHVEKDAEERFQNRKVREEKASTFKTQALKAFRRGEFERAITCYTKAIEQIKDSPSLYTNRCLAYMNLKFYDKAMEDAKQALYLNESSLKAGLLLAKIHFLKGNSKEFDQITDEIRDKHSDRAIFIEGNFIWYSFCSVFILILFIFVPLVFILFIVILSIFINFPNKIFRIPKRTGKTTRVKFCKYMYVFVL